MADSVVIVNKNITNDISELEKFKFLIRQDEEILLAYEGLLDAIVITNKKFIGLIGKRTEYTIIPISKISAISIESQSTFDTELKIWVSALGQFTTKISSSLIKNGALNDLSDIFNEYLCK